MGGVEEGGRWSGTFCKSYLDLKAAVKIRLYPRGNLGVKVEEGDFWKPSVRFLPLPFFLGVAGA